MKTNWKHDALAADLADYIRNKSDRLVWADMQLGPSGSSRPDVYSVPLSFARFQPIAYECKVSVSDYRADVTKGKWSDYLRYASAVIFAVPEGLIKKEDLPAGCGLMVRGEKGWRTVKGPTMRPVDNLPRDAWIKLLIDGVKREGERGRVRDAGTYGMIYAMEQKLGKDVAEVLLDRHRAESNFQYATDRINAARETLEAQEQAHVLRRRAHYEKEGREIDAARAALATALGLAEDAPAHELMRTAREMRNAVDRDREVARMKNQLLMIRHALDEADAQPKFMQAKPVPLLIGDSIAQGCGVLE